MCVYLLSLETPQQHQPQKHFRRFHRWMFQSLLNRTIIPELSPWVFALPGKHFPTASLFQGEDVLMCMQFSEQSKSHISAETMATSMPGNPSWAGGGLQHSQGLPRKEGEIFHRVSKLDRDCHLLTHSWNDPNCAMFPDRKPELKQEELALVKRVRMKSIFFFFWTW